MSAAENVKVTPAMKIDFDTCMSILKPADASPYKADVRDVIAAHGRDYAAQWLRNWVEILTGTAL